jgi:hypothetical protein
MSAWAEHLDRDGAVVLEIASEIDRGHPAAAELDRLAARSRDCYSVS